MNQKRVMGRSWAFVCYPESLPDNWIEIVRNTGLPMAFSPLHDKDLNPTGEEKKPHYHVICYYENPTTLNNVYENVCKLLNATVPIKLESMRGMFRYHLHLDNPEKYQYDDRDRQFFNGFDVASVNDLTKTEEMKLLKDILVFVKDNEIYELSDLLDYYLYIDSTELLDVSRRNSGIISLYITSKRNKKKQGLTELKK